MRFSLMATAALLSLANDAAAQETVTYTYDALGRLVTTSTSGGSNNGTTSSYAYDAASNRTNATVVTPSGGCSFEALDGNYNDEFSVYLTVRRTGVCPGNVQVKATSPDAGTYYFDITPADTQTLPIVYAGYYCCGTTIRYLTFTFSISSGVATMTDDTAVITLYPSG